MTDAEKVQALKNLLNTRQQYISDTCKCEYCEKSIKKGLEDKIACEECGYSGEFVACDCGCYDYRCAGAGAHSSGAGCAHGCLICPVCKGGEMDCWAMLREIREILK